MKKKKIKKVKIKILTKKKLNKLKKKFRLKELKK